MATVTHPTMRKTNTIQEEQQSPKTENYIVDDLSAFEGNGEPETENETIYETKPKKIISEVGRKRIEDLVFLGRTAKSIEIGGHIFEISTLTHREHCKLVEELAKIGDKLNAINIKIYTLSSALRSIDNTKLDDFETIEEYTNDFDKRVSLLDDMQLRVIERLFDEYNLLLKETDQIVTGDNLKKS